MLLLAVTSSVLAQTTVEQNSSTILNVNSLANVNYTWELYTGSSREFAHTSGNLDPCKARFLNNINTGSSVTVQWLEPGTYFFKVTATYVGGCTNNIKVGQIIVEPSSIRTVIARDDSYNFACEALEVSVIINDAFEKDASISTRLIYTADWNPKGMFKLSSSGLLSYDNYDVVPMSIDSMQYELIAKRATGEIEKDTAVIYISVGNNCTAPTVPIAVNDKYTVKCGANVLSITSNDDFNNEMAVSIDIIEWPTKGSVELTDNLNANYTPYPGSLGNDQFSYTIYYDSIPENFSDATVSINIPDSLNCSPETVPGEEFFIPEAFTPNGDGTHDYWVLNGVEQYPNGKMIVYSRAGNIVFKRENYGIIKHWGDSEKRWWDGTDATGNQVIAGVYLYEYDRGDKVIRGFVLVAYGEDKNIGNY